MPTYHWKGRRWNSEVLSEGTILADSLACARAEVLRQSFEVESIHLTVDGGLEGAQKLLEIRHPEKSRPDAFRALGDEIPSRQKKTPSTMQALNRWSYGLRRYFTRQGWTPLERVAFFRQLSLLLEAGVRLHRSFAILSQGQPDPVIAARLQRVPEEPCFDEGLRKTGLLNPFELAQVEAALQNGTLAITFLRLAEQAEQGSECRRLVWLQLSTPLTALTLCWLLTPVLGRLIGVLLGSLGELSQPGWTQWLATFLQGNIWLLLGWLTPLGLLWLARNGVEAFLSSPAGRRRMLTLPLLGRLCTHLDLAVSLRIFADLVEAGIRLERALDLTQRNSLLDCWTQMRVAVLEGQALHSGLEDGVLRQTVRAGEESGKLVYLCRKMHAFFEEEANARLRDLVSLVEPIATMLVALLVGATCWLCLSPILKIAQSL